MLSELHTFATVQHGGRIELTDTRLDEGDYVEVTVVVRNGKGIERPSALDVLAQAPGQRMFQSAAEVDQYVREERDAWER